MCGNIACVREAGFQGWPASMSLYSFHHLFKAIICSEPLEGMGPGDPSSHCMDEEPEILRRTVVWVQGPSGTGVWGHLMGPPVAAAGVSSPGVRPFLAPGSGCCRPPPHPSYSPVHLPPASLYLHLSRGFVQDLQWGDHPSHTCEAAQKSGSRTASKGPSPELVGVSLLSLLTLVK